MSNYSPGLLTLSSTTASSTLDIELGIPAQVLRFKGYRVEYNTSANALVDKIIYVELPFISRNQVIDNNVGRIYLPIPLDNAVVTLENSLDIPILMTEALPERFQMNVYQGPSGSYALVTNMVHISLSFELFSGHLT